MPKVLKKIYLIPRICLTAFLVFPAFLLSSQSWAEFLLQVILLTSLSIATQYKLVHPYLMQSRSLTQHNIRVILGLVISRPLLLLGILLSVLNYFTEPETTSKLGHALLYVGVVLNNSFYFGNLRILVYRIQEGLLFE